VIVAANLQKNQLTEKISLSRMENVQNIPTKKIYTIPNTVVSIESNGLQEGQRLQ
jgi:hypothetical protein